MYKALVLFLSLFLLACSNEAQKQEAAPLKEIQKPSRVFTGAEVLVRDSIALLQGKSVGIVGNHTSLVFGNTHLVDTLLDLNIQVQKVFSPEHGFRGDADAGARVKSITDPKTGLPIVSLYGKNKKPYQEQLSDLDVLLFDIQDVGARFYTYISTLTYVMEACAEAGIPVIVLDRPNPSGWYVEGPILNSKYASFIGMHEIPMVHGMTVGEYAQMINGESWLKDGLSCSVSVLKAHHYQHSMKWEETGLDWVSPSPNLATVKAAELYPALCWFEPTPMSVGRGTDSAFTIVGAPWFEPNEGFTNNEIALTSFTPRSIPGKSTYPKFQDKACNGYAFTASIRTPKELFITGIQLFKDAYQAHGAKPDFFKKNFERWTGYQGFREAIQEGKSAEAIYQSWRLGVESFKETRAKYLLYPSE